MWCRWWCYVTRKLEMITVIMIMVWWASSEPRVISSSPERWGRANSGLLPFRAPNIAAVGQICLLRHAGVAVGAPPICAGKCDRASCGLKRLGSRSSGKRRKSRERE